MKAEEAESAFEVGHYQRLGENSLRSSSMLAQLPMASIPIPLIVISVSPLSGGCVMLP